MRADRSRNPITMSLMPRMIAAMPTQNTRSTVLLQVETVVLSGAIAQMPSPTAPGLGVSSVA